MWWFLACVAAKQGAPSTGSTDTSADSADTSADSADSADTSGGWPPGVTLGPVTPCDAPADAPTYREVSAEVGLDVGASGDSFHGEMGGQVAVLDVDLDGDLDLLHAFSNTPLHLFRREGMAYTREDLTAIPAVPFHPWSLTTADLDNDGDLDVAVSAETSGILWNDAGALDRFTPLDIPLATMAQVRELQPVELNGDGWTDLFVVVGNDAGRDGSRTDQVLLNDHGTFSLGPPLDAVADRQGFAAVPLDWNDDGVLDLYVVNDMGMGNVLWQLGGEAPLDASAGCACGIRMNGMGGSVADADRDGAWEMYLTDASSNLLLHQLPDHSFVDATLSSGIGALEHDMAWGSAWADLDNDGGPEVLLAQGDLWGSAAPIDQPFQAFRSEGGAAYTDWTDALGLTASGSFRAVVPWEESGDGVLDVLVSEVTGPLRLFRSTRCLAAGWVEVAAPPGSRVTVEAGGERVRQWVTTDAGFAGAGPAQVHIGVGAAREVERLEVLLPSGELRLVEEPFEVNRRVDVSL